MRKMPNAQPIQFGTINGKCVSIQPSLNMMTKTGIMVTWAGTIIVASMMMKSWSRAQNFNRANA